MAIFILVGPPLSGKSTWTRDYLKRTEANTIRVNRDEIRKMIWGEFSIRDENLVTDIQDETIHVALAYEKHVIIDNTHCKVKYIEDIKKRYPEQRIVVKFFEAPPFLLHMRNIWRYLRGGVWIPFKVMKTMIKNYKNVKSHYNPTDGFLIFNHE